MTDHPLDAAALASVLARLPAWRGDAGALLRTYEFPSFITAIAFMHDCAPTIDNLDHHPHWTNSYRTVEVRLTTHDAGDRVTAKDAALAEVIERVARSHHAI